MANEELMELIRQVQDGTVPASALMDAPEPQLGGQFSQEDIQDLPTDASKESKTSPLVIGIAGQSRILDGG